MQVPFSWQPPNPDMPIGLLEEKRDSSLQRTCLHCSRVQWLCIAVVVVPSYFQFVITPLTVDSGIFSSKEISQMDLLHRW
ncbi:unnamed protein product [Staurois parvus]|uniref:Uncharacterized protein n=1 Tax=Staurois parvus TaxID=386267 RepID=A0ABN9HNM0_9NEOB|nr:unnamed protein product [Staurois parvus]